MPNIIEQQDLLKGLPDNRLALLLQKPDAAIPPFLVAAEAQRRQAIRQQFAGQGQNESVVDSLTKQMANVPQNVQAPMQAPPKMPAPMMPQAGIAALQPQQAPQQMAGGGQVQRYQVGSLVTPSVSDLAAGITSVPLEEYKRKAREEEIRKLGPGRARYLLENPTMPTTEAKRAEQELYAATEGPLSAFSSPEDVYEAAQAVEKAGSRIAAAEATPSPVDAARTASVYKQYADSRTKKPADPTVGKKGTSTENQDAAESADYRSMLEELYAVEEPSNWEEAQKWFAMSAQIMNPDANLLQGLANAGAVYSEAEAEQAAAKRAGELEMKKALLQYDIGERDYAREVAAQRQSDQLAAMKYRAEFSLKDAAEARKTAEDEADAMNKYIAGLQSSGTATPESIAKDPIVLDYQERIRRANKRANDAMINAQGFNTLFGNVYGLPTGFDVSDGESLYKVGG